MNVEQCRDRGKNDHCSGSCLLMPLLDAHTLLSQFHAPSTFFPSQPHRLLLPLEFNDLMSYNNANTLVTRNPLVL